LEPEQDKILADALTLEQRPKSHAAAEETFRTEQKRLFRFIRQRVRTEEDAEDILSDVFYQLMSSYNVAEPIEKMTSWLFTVARNRIIDWYRKKRPDPLPRDNDNPALPLNLEDILYDPTQNPDRVYERSLVWTELAEALDDLPEEQKEVFVMHELEGKSFKEIAEITGEPVNTLLSRKRYAVLYLREKLQELYNEFNEQEF
jgi:RNA polymerase sigma factor (sigma-70 family)